MYRYLIADVAQAELDGVGEFYVAYFTDLGDPAKGHRWASRFYSEYRAKIESLKSNPFRYPICDLYPFDVVETRYRSFRVGWYTVFYAVDECKRAFVVLHVRSSRSDFTKIADREPLIPD